MPDSFDLACFHLTRFALTCCALTCLPSVPRVGFADTVAAMDAAGIVATPYTNGRIFDPSIPKWDVDHAKAHMCKGAEGYYRELYVWC